MLLNLLSKWWEALLTVDLKLTKRAGRLSTVDQVRGSVKLCSPSATPLTVPHLSSRGGGEPSANTIHSIEQLFCWENVTCKTDFFTIFRKLKVYSSSIGGEGRDKPKKQKTHLRGKCWLPQTQFPHITIWVGNIVTCKKRILQKINIYERKAWRRRSNVLKQAEASSSFFSSSQGEVLLNIFCSLQKKYHLRWR